jgi:hypothetical protein
MRAAVLVTAMLFGVAADAPSPAPDWIAGAWSERTGTGWTEEYWTPMRGHIMLGAGFTGKGDAVRHWEQMRIERGADGKFTFWGSPKGAPAVSFPATKISANEIVFVNPAHDYPQRVRYWRVGKSLMAEISLADGSKANRWTYTPMGG